MEVAVPGGFPEPGTSPALFHHAPMVVLMLMMVTVTKCPQRPKDEPYPGTMNKVLLALEEVQVAGGGVGTRGQRLSGRQSLVRGDSGRSPDFTLE